MADDVVVQPIRILEAFKAGGRTAPTYLVLIENGKTKLNFVAVKYDDSFVHCGKFVGFYCDKSVEEIKANYDQVIKDTDIGNFIEILFPWNKIFSIQSLVYRHKQTK